MNGFEALPLTTPAPEPLAFSNPAVVTHSAAEQDGFSYVRANGVVEYAATKDDAFRRCPVLRVIVQEDPSFADMLWDLQVAGQEIIDARKTEDAVEHKPETKSVPTALETIWHTKKPEAGNLEHPAQTETAAIAPLNQKRAERESVDRDAPPYEAIPALGEATPLHRTASNALPLEISANLIHMPVTVPSPKAAPAALIDHESSSAIRTVDRQVENDLPAHVYAKVELPRVQPIESLRRSEPAVPVELERFLTTSATAPAETKAQPSSAATETFRSDFASEAGRKNTTELERVPLNKESGHQLPLYAYEEAVSTPGSEPAEPEETDDPLFIDDALASGRLGRDELDNALVSARQENSSEEVTELILPEVIPVHNIRTRLESALTLETPELPQPVETVRTLSYEETAVLAAQETYEQIVALTEAKSALRILKEQTGGNEFGALPAPKTGLDVALEEMFTEPATASFETFAAAKQLPETPTTIEALTDAAKSNVPLEHTIVMLVELATVRGEQSSDSALRYEAVVEVIHEIEMELSSSGQSHAKSSRLEHITPAMTEKILTLIQLAGYAHPHETLIRFVAAYDLTFLLQALQLLCQAHHRDYRYEAPAKAGGYAALSNRPTQRLGKLLVALFGRNESRRGRWDRLVVLTPDMALQAASVGALRAA